MSSTHVRRVDYTYHRVSADVPPRKRSKIGELSTFGAATSVDTHFAHLSFLSATVESDSCPKYRLGGNSIVATISLNLGSAISVSRSVTNCSMEQHTKEAHVSASGCGLGLTSRGRVGAEPR